MYFGKITAKSIAILRAELARVGCNGYLLPYALVAISWHSENAWFDAVTDTVIGTEIFDE